MPEPLLKSKLTIPPAPTELIIRSRLLQHLDSSAHAKLTLLSAPAGYGKTTLLSTWATANDLAVAWLTLDSDDNNSAHFLTYFTSALQSIAPETGQASRTMLQAVPPTPINAVLMTLVNELASIKTDCYLVLDDYHRIESQEVHETLSYLIDKLTPHLHIVLSSRSDPPLPIGRLRAQGQLVELRQADLRFTTNEVRTFLNQQRNLILTEDQVAKLDTRTEGWIAGLQLAAISLSGKADADQFIEDFGGSHRFVIDFLAEEILAEKPAKLVRFMVETSVLDRLTAPLCDFVTGAKNSVSILEQLEEENLFLLPLDEQREWYRYQQLFRDFLRYQLDEKQEAALNAKAARWFLEHELYSDAIRHAQASGDMAWLIDTIKEAAPVAFNRGSHNILLSWLKNIPEEQILGNPDLSIFKGFALFLTDSYEMAIPYARSAEITLTDESLPSTRGRLLSLKGHIATCMDENDDSLRFCRQALTLLDEGDYLFRNLTSNVLGQLLEMRGDVLSAANVYEEAFETGWLVGDQMGTLVVFANLIFALNEVGNRREALTRCKHMKARSKSITFQQMPLLDAVLLPWSLLSLEASRLDRAHAQVERALRLLSAANFSQGIIWCHYIMARLHLARGEFPKMFESTTEGFRLAKLIDHETIQGTWFTSLEAQAYLQQGNLEQAAWWAETSGFSPDDSPHHWSEYPYFTYIRILIAQTRLEEALRLIQTMKESARFGKRDRKLITIYLLHATSLKFTGDTAGAVRQIEHALRIAAPENYRQAFFDEGQPILTLLPLARNIAPAFVEALISEMRSPVERVAPVDPLMDPLSPRELEVLRHVAMGLSNREIADALYVTVGTVKKHLNNIFSKMGVRSRTQAVARSREIGLLE